MEMWWSTYLAGVASGISGFMFVILVLGAVFGRAP